MIAVAKGDHEQARSPPALNFRVDLIFAIALQDRVALAAQDYPSGAAASGRGSTLLPTVDTQGLGLRYAGWCVSNLRLGTFMSSSIRISLILNTMSTGFRR
jgi:hypothetical protein